MENVKRYTITLDDDPSMPKIIAKATGIPSLPFTSSQSLIKRANSYDPVATFIDVNLAADDCGLDIVPQLRSLWPFSPIIVITGDAKGELVGQALAMGASDFVHKPFQAAEIVGRLHARINEMTARRKADVVKVGDLEFSISRMCLENQDRSSFLPRLESQILLLLLENRDMLVSRETIKSNLWGKIAVSENTLDKKISHIRAAINAIGANVIIESHYGKGFLLKISEKIAA